MPHFESMSLGEAQLQSASGPRAALMREYSDTSSACPLAKRDDSPQRRMSRWPPYAAASAQLPGILRWTSPSGALKTPCTSGMAALVAAGAVCLPNSSPQPTSISPNVDEIAVLADGRPG